MYSIVDLHDDVLIHLFSLIPVSDILTVRQTCRRFSCLTKLRIIWCNKFCTEVLSKKLPIPGSLCPFDKITGEDLEWRTKRALRLERQWHTSSTVGASVSLALPKKDVKKVLLLPGGNEALTVHPDFVQLWQRDATTLELAMKPTASWIFAEQDSTVVRDSACSDRIAVASYNGTQSAVEVLDVTPQQPFAKRCSYATLPGRLVGMHENFLVLDATEIAEDDEKAEKALILVDYNSSTQSYATLQQLPFYGNYLSHTMFADHLVVIWEHFLSTYRLPHSPSDCSGILDPSHIFRLRNRVQLPVAFTPCQATYHLPGTEESKDEPQFLTIYSKPAERIWGMSGSVLRTVLYVADKASGEFGLAGIPTSVQEECEAISMGPSGRGVWVEHGNVHQCIPRSVYSFNGPIPTADFEDFRKPLCHIPVHSDDLCVDFDDGMGRLAVASGGEVKIIDFV
ncbi:hypothetical protein C8Q75DRAFT_730854 [Abortiporus biennis]|nr:hypothetical protein C8Q75DRAFT_730854 [Abortiporus biennis]